MRRHLRTAFIALGLSLAASCAVLMAPGVAGIAVNSADAAVIDRIVARVGDEVITHWELEQATTPYLLQQGMRPSVMENPERRREIYGEVLDELISRELIKEEARKIDLSVTDQQVDQWLKYTRSRQGLSEQQFRTMLQRYGMTYDTYRETVRQNLLKIRLVKVKLGSQISVPQSEVDKSYRKRFGGGEGAGTSKVVTLRHILIQPEAKTPEARKAARQKAREVLQKLEGGASFEKLAKQHSQGPSAKKGGLLGSFKRGELNEAFEKVAFELQAGEHSGVVDTQFGFHILRVDDIGTGSNASPEVEKKKKQIRQQLRQKKLQEQLGSYVKKLRREAFVDVHEDAVVLGE